MYHRLWRHLLGGALSAADVRARGDPVERQVSRT